MGSIKELLNANELEKLSKNKIVKIYDNDCETIITEEPNGKHIIRRTVKSETGTKIFVSVF